MSQDEFNFDHHGDLAEEAKPRLSRQCHLILEKLQAGPITNHELSQIALSYTRRISDLRQHGYAVEIVERNDVTGANTYALVQS